ncbi:TIR domain-containing protein [Azospirillum argentinense]
MARRVFFSFHYARDIRRVVQVRNSWVVRAKGEAQPFLDKAEWESIKRTGSAQIERWIEKQMEGTSVTVVLFGRETFNREWVKHEIKRSYELGKGIVAVDIHKINDPQTGADLPGQNPLLHWSAKQTGRNIPFTELYKTYDWVSDEGYNNFPLWVEAAAIAAGR